MSGPVSASIEEAPRVRSVTVAPVGAQGPPGDQGPPGADGVDGAPGAPGSTGPSGPAGTQGAQGPQGVPGAAGAKGDTGAQGPPGADGAAGAQGPQGAAGPQGTAGQSFTWRGVWSAGLTYAVDDAVSGSDGSSYISVAAGNVGHDPTTDDGTHWSLSVIHGAPGPQGAQGPQGAAGAAGPQGPAGADGAAGAAGAQGAVGPAGPQGPAGAAGAQGPAGPAEPMNALPAATGDVDLAGYKLTTVGDAAADGDALNRRSGDARYVPQAATTFLPLPSGVAATDTAALNTALARGGRIRPNPLAVTAAYSLTAPLVVPSGIDADFGGCTFTLTGQFNMLQNAAVAPVHTAADATTQVGSAVVASPTLAAQASVGQALAVVGAGPPGGNGGGAIWLYGTVSQVVGNNITITNGAAGFGASVALANATAYLFNRDSAIRISGGVWNSASIWNTLATRQAAGFSSHLMRFRRVDGLTVRSFTLKATGFPAGGGWAFGVNPGDCTDVLIDDGEAVGTSTLVQGDGPLTGVTVRNMRGQSQDDMIAFGCVGFQGNDVEGDISGLLIDGVWSNGSWRAVDVFAGQGGNAVQRVLKGTARSVKGSTVREGVRTTDYAGAGAGPVTLWTDDITVTPGGGFAGQANSASLGKLITATGAGGELGSAQVTAGQSGIGSAVTDLTNLSITITAPSSGAVMLEAWVYSVQQATNPGVPVLYITDSANAIQTQATAGSLATGAFSPSVPLRKKLTGLTPGQSYTFKMRASVAAGSMGIIAGANNTAFLRALSA